MNKEELLDNAHIVSWENKEFIPNDNGLIDKELLRHFKIRHLLDSIKYLTDIVVDYKEEYPTIDGTEVTFNTDFVVLPREDFDKLKKELDV